MERPYIYLEGYGLTDRVWAFLFFPNPCFGPNWPGFCVSFYGVTRAWHRAHCSFGLASGVLNPFLYLYQLPPSPCVRTAWARAAINPATVVISTCLFGCGLIKPDRRYTWYVNDDPLGFRACFSYSPCFSFISCRPLQF